MTDKIKLKPGPSIAGVMARIAGIPAPFTWEPLPAVFKKNPGRQCVNTAALVSDLMLDLGGLPPDGVQLKKFSPIAEGADASYLRLIQILCHIYSGDLFKRYGVSPDKILSFLLSAGLNELSKTVGPEEFINDADRREELARLAVMRAGLCPEGETEAASGDRLTTLDSIERKKILEKTKAAQERARELREAMERQEAEEAASKMSRE